MNVFPRPLSLLVLSAALLASAGACVKRPQERSTVAVSIFPLYDIARRVAGDRVDVELILPPGQNAHAFDPRPGDVARLSNASVVFVVGLGLDDWVSSAVVGAGAGKARVFELGPLVDPILIPEGLRPAATALHASGAQGAIDPHFWFDPLRMQRMTDLMVDTLRTLDPEQGPAYRTRGDAVKASLQQLHLEAERRSRLWPRRRIATQHGSLFYFARRYGLEVTAVVEPSTEREPTPQHLAEVVAAILQTDTRALLVDREIDSTPSRAVQAETHVPLFEMDAIGGRRGSESYEAMMHGLLDVLDRALQ